MKKLFFALLSVLTMSAFAQIEVTTTGDSEFLGLATFKRDTLFSALFERGFTDGSASANTYGYSPGNAHFLGRSIVFESAVNIARSSSTRVYRFLNSNNRLTLDRVQGGGTQSNTLLVVSEDDNIGIGTTSPTHSLEVSGDFKNLYNAPGWAGWIENSGSGATNSGLVVTAGDDSADKTLLLRKRDGTETFTVLGNGNVGIGTTTPETTLEVNGSTRTNLLQLKGGGIRTSIPNTTGGWARGILYYPSGTYDFNELAGIGLKGTGTSLDHIFIGFGDDPWGNVQAMYVRSDGSVGIGTSDTFGEKLAVNGKIIAQDMISTEASLAWPDYVFENEYDLLSLQEVEKHINQKGHLPNVPSAKEVEEKGGVALGEMNKKLLEKVEELTLYLIDQNKQLKKQEQRIKVLEKELKTRKK